VLAAAVVQVPVVRRPLGRQPLIAASAALLTLGAVFGVGV
jgi:hypothetical protein